MRVYLLLKLTGLARVLKSQSANHLSLWKKPAAAESSGVQYGVELNGTHHVNNTLQDLVQLAYWVTVTANKYNKV